MADRGRQEPTQSVILPYTETLGQEAIDLYNQTERTAQLWQESLLNNIMAQNEDGLWVHTKFGWSVPRRNGKSEVLLMRAIWGIKHGERILYTAHKTTTSHLAWMNMVSMMHKLGMVEKEDYKSSKQFGLECIHMLDSEAFINFRTRTTTGGLGEGYDLLIIDEAQEYTEPQDTALKYTVTDSKNPQTLYCGTPPTVVSSGTVFSKFRDDTMMGERLNSGWAEWSVEKQTDPHDREAWYIANPSLGLIFTERSVADEIGSDDIDFNIQRLGLWIKYNQKSAISRAEWESLQIDGKPDITGKLYVGIRYGIDSVNVAVAIAAKTMDDKIFAEVIDCRPMRNGNDWILEFLSKADVAGVVIDGACGQGLLEKEMRNEHLKPPVLPKVKEVIRANSTFEMLLTQGRICHADQPSLTQVVANCEKRPIGSSGGFGYKSQIDDYEIVLLDSVILASWMAYEAREHKKQRVNY